VAEVQPSTHPPNTSTTVSKFDLLRELAKIAAHTTPHPML
jgi:hypothetical protein